MPNVSWYVLPLQGTGICCQGSSCHFTDMCPHAIASQAEESASSTLYRVGACTQATLCQDMLRHCLTLGVDYLQITSAIALHHPAYLSWQI